MEILILLALVAGIPIAYFVALIQEIVSGRLLGVLLSLVIATAVAATAAWATSQARGDWADLGYFFVPMQAGLAGWLVLRFSRWQHEQIPTRRILAWVGLAFSVLLIGFNFADGIRTASKNRAEREYDEAQFGEFLRDEKFIEAGLTQNALHKEAWLDSTIRTQLEDSVFLSVAARYDFISPGLLDTLANSPFPPVAAEAILNPGTRPQTLARSYRAHSNSDFFVPLLAHNPHTPPAILREIYHRPHNSIGIEGALANNPSSPRDVLAGLAESATYPETIQALLTNRVLDCALLTRVASYLAGSGKSLSLDYNVARMNEVRPIVCSGKEAPTTSAPN